MTRVLRILLGVGLIVLHLGVVAQAPSSGQVTTTTTTTGVSTSSTSSTVPATTTTAPPPTIPTVPPNVPVATLSGASGQVSGELGSFAWPQANGIMVARIVDYVISGPNPAQELTATQGETLTLRFAPDLPVATLTASVWPGGQGSPTLAVPAANPSRFVMTLAPGTHVFTVQATFQGVPNASASYAFKVRVVAADGRPLALTG